MVAVTETARSRCLDPAKTLTPGPRLQQRGRRYYSPELGRWLNRDAIGESGGLAVYVFARNNSIESVDNLGLSPIAIGEDPNPWPWPYIGPPDVDVDPSVPALTFETKDFIVWDCSHFLWTGLWKLSKPAQKGGYILQEIAKGGYAYKCDRGEAIDLGLDKHGAVFWEVFSHVPPGMSAPDPNVSEFGDYWLFDLGGEGSWGRIAITGRAQFWDGIEEHIPNHPPFSGQFSPTWPGWKNIGRAGQGATRALQIVWYCCCGITDVQVSILSNHDVGSFDIDFRD